jgi:dolichol kinase
MFSDLAGAGVLLAYYLVFAFLAPTLLKTAGVPTEWVRKTQHVVYSLSVFLLLRLFSAWYWAVLAASLLAVVAYPALWAIEKHPRYRQLFVDRTARGGELRKQLIYVQLTFALLLLIFWGLLGARWQYVVAAAVMAWGFGDAAAALVGRAFGRRRFLHRLIEGGKTYAGTGAMIAAAGVALFFTLLLYAGKPWYLSLLISAIVAPVCGVVELFSRKGTDTLTVPLAAAASILSVAWICGLLGW